MSVVPTPGQINLVVRDLARSIAFYRLLGWNVGEPTGLHVSVPFGDGFVVDLDQHEFAQQWNSGTPTVNGGSAVLCLGVGERGKVDEIVERMTAAGHRVRQVPYDTFWGSRFAIIDDPDGYQIGLMSPSMAEHRYWPPRDAPVPSLP